MTTCRVPLIPIIGESLQHEFPTGEKLYCEQIGYKPSITAFSFVGKDDAFNVYGSHEYLANFKMPNSLVGNKKGKFEIKFKDGTHYTISEPKMIIHNLITGVKNQIYYEHAILTDHTNKLEADIHYNPHAQKTTVGKISKGWGGLARKITGAKKSEAELAKNADDMAIQIYIKQENI